MMESSEKKDTRVLRESIICVICIVLFFRLFAGKMGLVNTMNTMINTAYELLIGTAFYIMAMAVVAGAFSEILTEFGVVELFNRILSHVMKPLYGLPGSAALGIISTYFSDNPAILSLTANKRFISSFRKYQLPSLTNLGTAFGMGLIVTAFMSGLDTSEGNVMARAVICGNLGAVAGSIVSTRLMLHHTKKVFGDSQPAVVHISDDEAEKSDTGKKNIPLRILDSLIGGGKNGVDLGLGIVPGVLIICTIVMMLTYGEPDGGYSGGAYEGIALLPLLGEKLSFIIEPLFGFRSSSCIAVPVTALGSAGASLGIVKSLFEQGLAGAGDIAVFTAMCMCWSGYLSTHVSMMDVLGFHELTGKAILYHTIGGIAAGVAAHWMFRLVMLI